MIVVQDVEDPYIVKEMSITMKQATNLLMKCEHSFKEFVGELLCIR